MDNTRGYLIHNYKKVILCKDQRNNTKTPIAKLLQVLSIGTDGNKRGRGDRRMNHSV